MGRCEALKQKLYPPEEQDNDLVFLRMIEDCVTAGRFVLDLGAGTGSKFKYDLKTKVEPDGEVIGVDFDARVTRNPLLHRGVVMDSHSLRLPFSDNTFDVVFSRYVLEHVGNPSEFLGEIWRVLRPGGSFLFLTPNKWHYVSMASSLTPKWFHNWYNQLRGRDKEDTFPTFYHLNSVSTIRQQFNLAGFEECSLVLRECCPNYLTFCMPAFLLGVAYERLVNTTNLLARMRVNILGSFKKPPTNSI